MDDNHARVGPFDGVAARCIERDEDIDFDALLGAHQDLAGEHTDGEPPILTVWRDRVVIGEVDAGSLDLFELEVPNATARHEQEHHQG